MTFEPTANLEQAECHNPDGVYSMLAAFAIATANELHRWEYSDFVVVNNRLALSTAGQATCDTTGNCPSLTSLLNMQGAQLLVINGQRVFDPSQYSEQLKVYNDRARITWSRYTAQPWYTERHHLTFDHRDPGLCSWDYTYGAVERGGDGGTLEYPERLLDKLIIAGYPENGWLVPRVQGNQVTIDPEPGMTVDPILPADPGACVSYCWLFDPDRSEEGRCCTCSGVEGRLEASSFDASTLACDLGG